VLVCLTNLVLVSVIVMTTYGKQNLCHEQNCTIKQALNFTLKIGL